MKTQRLQMWFEDGASVNYRIDVYRGRTTGPARLGPAVNFTARGTRFDHLEMSLELTCSGTRLELADGMIRYHFARDEYQRVRDMVQAQLAK